MKPAACPDAGTSRDRGRRLKLSVVVPAWDEYKRLPGLLVTVRAYLEREFVADYEVIVVDDGSADGTLDFLEDLTEGWNQLTVVRHFANHGKGAAVKTGMAYARGELSLYADADGATPIAEEAKLRMAIDAGADVAIGSRAKRGTERRCSRGTLRGFVGWFFGLLRRATLRLEVRDTQCGFKMFRREAGQRLFAQLEENGFAFDLELLGLARVWGYRVAEIPVKWREVPGSKVRIARDSWRMLVSVVSIRRRLRRALLTGASTQRYSDSNVVPELVAK